MNLSRLKRGAAVALSVSAILGSGAAAAQVQMWAPAGAEDGRRTAVDVRRAQNEDRSRAVVRQVLSLSERGGYAITFFSYDCAAGTRTPRGRVDWSPLRDPVHADLAGSPTLKAADSPAVRRQLQIVCRPDGAPRIAGRTFTSIDDFVNAFR